MFFQFTNLTDSDNKISEIKSLFVSSSSSSSTPEKKRKRIEKTKEQETRHFQSFKACEELKVLVGHSYFHLLHFLFIKKFN